MADTQQKILSTGTPSFVRAGGKRAITTTYPKSGQEQSVSLDQGPYMDHPGGHAETFTEPKSGAKQHI